MESTSNHYHSTKLSLNITVFKNRHLNPESREDQVLQISLVTINLHKKQLNPLENSELDTRSRMASQVNIYANHMKSFIFVHAMLIT